MNQIPTNESCLRNQDPIAQALKPYLARATCVLEVGSGTGQHAAYLAKRHPTLVWQPTELPSMLPIIDMWTLSSGCQNVLPAIELDASTPNWPTDGSFDLVFTSNTIHFVSAPIAENIIDQSAAQLKKKGGKFCVYGPFNEGGRFTSEGNENLDMWLKERDPKSGIKNLENVIKYAATADLKHLETIRMPANNLTLIFEKV